MNNKTLTFIIIFIISVVVGNSYLEYENQPPVVPEFSKTVTKTLKSVVLVTASGFKKDAQKELIEKDGKPIPTGGIGTGFFISKDMIVTNYHVVGGDIDIIKIVLNKGQGPFKATIYRYDKPSDIAILKIKDENFLEKWAKPIKWGKSKELTQGEEVFAVGHPMGLYWSVSKGVVSHNARRPNEFQVAIQTDTTVNTGNSGGPLFNLKGEVVGVNTFILGASGKDAQGKNISLAGSIGLNFAVSQYTAEFVVTNLIESNDVPRAEIGVILKDDDGKVIIEKVEENKTAHSSGAKNGDIVISIGGIKVKSVEHFVYLLERKFKPRDEVELVVMRNEITKLKLFIGVKSVYDGSGDEY